MAVELLKRLACEMMLSMQGGSEGLFMRIPYSSLQRAQCHLATPRPVYGTAP